MPKWISIEVTDPNQPPATEAATTEGAPEAAPSAGSSNALAWIASLAVTLLLLVLAGGIWYFGIRPNQTRAASVPLVPAASAPAGAPAGVGVPAPLDDLPAVVATVNGENITREQLTQLIRINQALYPVTNGSEVVLDPTTLMNMRTTLLEQMVNNRLELQAAKAQGMTVTDADVEAEYTNFKTVYRADDAKLEAALTRFNLTPMDIKNWLRESVLINRFVAQTAQQYAKEGKPYSRESWLNDQLVKADVQVSLAGAGNNIPLKVGEAPPNFTLKDLNGKTWTLAELKGKPVVVNFWATWCAPCKFEMPHFEKAYQKYKDQGLVVLAIDIRTDNGEPAVRKYVSDMGLTFPTPMDVTGQTEQDYRVRAYPTTYFIGRDGKLREIKRGAFISPEQLNASVDKIMQQ